MRIGFVSTNAFIPWGGSEELWSRAASVLLQRGHQVAFNCVEWPTVPTQLLKLIDEGALPHFRPRWRLGRSLRSALERLKLLQLTFARWLHRTKPEFVLISFSWHGDDPQIANTCRLLGIRYAIVLQSAGTHHWIPSRALPEVRSAYAHAERCYFVSADNRDILESQLAIELPHAEIVDNPFAVRVDAAPAWPPAHDFWRLACVARIHFVSKSQDLLVRVLRRPKWRTRPLRVTLWGADQGFLPQLRQMIDLYGLQERLIYGGFANDIEALWSAHHGLLLPSRLEGNALSLIEAMLCGRVPITTNVGRAAEFIEDNQSGFIAPSATADSVDEVLERAWHRRNDWQVMGQRAARAIRERHSLRPAEDFADRIVSMASHRGCRQRVAA